MIRWLMSLSLLFATSSFALDLPREARVPGGIAFVRVPGHEQPPRVLFGAYQAAVIRKDSDWVAIVGIPLATKP